MGWPSAVTIRNEFAADSIDIDTFDFPKLKVTTWSHVFSKGGQYSIEMDAPGRHNSNLFEGIEVTEDDPHAREHLKDLVEEFNEDPRGNWIKILLAAAESTAAYRQKQVDGFAKVVEDNAKAQARLGKIRKLSEEF